jgi:hypothetical protein
VKARRKSYGKSYGWIGGMAGMTLFFCLAIAHGQPVLRAVPVIADDLDRESLRAAIAQSLVYLAKLPSDRIVAAEPRRFTAAEVMATLQAFTESLERWQCRQCWIEEIANRFDFLPSSSNPELQSVLVTGYYQPVIEASLAPTAEYRYPIYGIPDDLIIVDEAPQSAESAGARRIGRLEGDNLVPYYSRAEIDYQGALRERGYEIAWTKDPVDIFFLQIQGSGILQLPDRRRLQVGYAGQNGLPYRSIGRLLIDGGKIPAADCAAILRSIRRSATRSWRITRAMFFFVLSRKVLWGVSKFPSLRGAPSPPIRGSSPKARWGSFTQNGRCLTPEANCSAGPLSCASCSIKTPAARSEARSVSISFSVRKPRLRLGPDI